MPRVTKSELSRKLGICRQSLPYHVKRGLKFDTDRRIDLRRALEWFRQYSVGKVYAAACAALAVTDNPTAVKGSNALLDSRPPESTSEAGNSSCERPMLDRADALKKKENYLALLRELEYDRESRKVVEAGESARLIAKEFAIVRNQLLSIPARAAARIVMIRDPQEAQDYLMGIISEALEELTFAARKRAAELMRLSHDRR